MKGLGGLVSASIASFIGGIAVIFFQYYWLPAASTEVDRGKIEIIPNFEVSLDKAATAELVSWFVSEDRIQEAVREDDEISIYAYRLDNRSNKDLTDINIQIHAEDYRDEFSVVHAAMTDPFNASVMSYEGGSDRWRHIALQAKDATASTKIALLKAEESVILLLATNYSQAPEIDIRSGGIDIVKSEDETASADLNADEAIDLTWLIVLAFGVGGLLLGLAISEKIHRTALNSIGFDYDELAALVKEQNSGSADD